MATKLVVLITDDAALTELVEVLLSEMSINVLSSDDPAKVIRQRRHIKANLLLVDTSMPDALETIKQLKANPLTHNIPLIALCYATSIYAVEEVGSAMLAGADDVVVKSSMANNLVEKVRKYLYKHT